MSRFDLAMNDLGGTSEPKIKEKSQHEVFEEVLDNIVYGIETFMNKVADTNYDVENYETILARFKRENTLLKQSTKSILDGLELTDLSDNDKSDIEEYKGFIFDILDYTQEYLNDPKRWTCLDAYLDEVEKRLDEESNSSQVETTK
jgi:hypothetical protein